MPPVEKLTKLTLNELAMTCHFEVTTKQMGFLRAARARF